VPPRRWYYKGPTQDGKTGPSIFDDVERQVLTDVGWVERNEKRDVAIDMVGYSRGAVIAATVAKDLMHTHFINKQPRTISVNWVGLFDPVSLFFGYVPKKDLSWATSLPLNVQSSDCAIKTKGPRILPTQSNYYEIQDEEKVAAITGQNMKTKEYAMNHHDIGHNVEVLGWMIKEAQNRGHVPVT
jgi:hypothetical protein